MIKTTDQIVKENVEVQLWKNGKLKTIVDNGFKKWISINDIKEIVYNITMKKRPEGEFIDGYRFKTELLEKLRD